MSNICIIPARGGSKRIPGKNIKSFLGEPIIVYSIRAARESGLFDEIMVSTDDNEIAKIAIQAGASIPFMRSSENADEFATLTDVLLEVVAKYENIGKKFDNICCILPTAPLINSQRIITAFEKITSESFNSVCPVVEFSYPILRALEFSNNNLLQMVWPEYEKSRSQDLKKAYHDSGSFYWVKTTALLDEKTLFCKKGSAVILSEMEIQDIDTETDWALAEVKFKINNNLL